MKTIIIALLLTFAVCEEMLVTQEHTDYLKKHVTWEVADYSENVFRGWTKDEVASIMAPEDAAFDTMPGTPVAVSDAESLPASKNWKELRADCIHEAKNQGRCASGWAFTGVGVVSDRCCLRLKDYGWLSAQELISCDDNDMGCNGGMATDVMLYAAQNGIVSEKCYPYVAKEEKCPTKCVDGSDWAKAHVCHCKTKVTCSGVEGFKTCLQSGPVNAVLLVRSDFMYYKGGVYHEDKKSQKLGRHTLRCYGYSDKPEFHWMCANSWGTTWGEAGSIRIAKNTTDMEGNDASYCDPAQ
ncbi:MAG: C1 family peptidase [Candidatus Pacebacteria bacterium]|nr:C1 family peptidase [Candidatus Paceibacterota bacterium]